MKERGSALLTAVIIVMVLLAISGILFTMVNYRAKNESSEEKGLRAYYLAEAGIQYGIAAGIEAVLNGTLTLEEGGTLSPPRVNDPFGQGGWFKVTVTREAGAASFTVKSTGEYFEARRIKKAEYGFGEEGDDDDDDDGDDEDDDGDYCDDIDLPEYPPWTAKDYPGGSYVSYDGRVFYARYYTSSNQVPGIPGNFWQQVTRKWTDFNSYNQNDIVCYNGKKYQARYNMTDRNKVPGEIENGNFWQELTNEWRDFNSYNQGDFVWYNGRLFAARYNMTDNVEKVPGEIENGNFWQEMTNEYTDFNSYNQGDIVRYEGKFFIARSNMTDQTAKIPGEGGNGNQWQELTDEWRAFNFYNSGDTVLYNGQWYRAKHNIGQNSKNPEQYSGAWSKVSTGPAPILMGILVTPMSPPPAIKVGETQTFTAAAVYSNGSTTEVDASWQSSNTSIATMAGRVATAHAAGIVTGRSPIPISTSVSIPVPITIPITAAFQGKVGKGYLTVKVSTHSNPDPDPDPDPGNNGGILWEKEVIE